MKTNTNTNNIILGSSSPRRKELFKKIVPTYSIIPPTFDEELIKNKIKDPKMLVRLLSINKALNISKTNKNKYVISLDTLVVFNNEIMNKPITEEKAKEYLLKLNNNTHEVLTSFAIAKDELILYTDIVSSKIFINKLNEEQIDKYIQTKSPLDRAGGYGIQDTEYITCNYDTENDYYNTMGMPLKELKEALINLNIIKENNM